MLLIDEIDRADDDFEAFLLELLGEAAVTIPELGTIRATHPPIIVLTSNRTRDLHDAVKRRCLYHWIDYPSPQREVEIVRRRVKGAPQTLAVQVADAVSRMRDSDVQKPPGIAEAIDWLAALERARHRGARRGGDRPHARLGAQVRRGPGGGPHGRPRPARAAAVTAFGVETIELDLPPLAAGLARRLHEAGLPMTPDRAAGFARALELARPVSRRRLYWTARAVFVSDQAQVEAFDRVFAEVFGERAAEGEPPEDVSGADGGQGSVDVPSAPGRSREGDEELEVPVALASDEERLASKRFDELDAAELAQLYRLMARLELATPLRRTRRHERGAPRTRHRPAAQPARRACAPVASRCRSRAGSGGSSRGGW